MRQSHKARELDTIQFHEVTAADVMERVIQSAHQRTKGDVLASMMIEGFGVERSHHADVIRAGRDVRHQIREIQTGLSMLLEDPRRAHDPR